MPTCRRPLARHDRRGAFSGRTRSSGPTIIRAQPGDPDVADAIVSERRLRMTTAMVSRRRRLRRTPFPFYDTQTESNVLAFDSPSTSTSLANAQNLSLRTLPVYSAP